MKRAAVILLLQVLTLVSVTLAQQDIDTAKNLTVTGTDASGASSILLRVTPLDASPAVPREYNISATDGAFSQQILLFPGQNRIEATGAAGTQTIQVGLNVRPPRLRVQLTWAGARQDYDLYVNDVYYGNRGAGGGALDRDVIDQSEPATENITFEAAPAGLYRIYVNYYNTHETDSQGNAKANPQATTVKVFVDETEIYTDERTIPEYEGLGALSGNGKSVWNVGTVVLHSESRAGGFTVDPTGYIDLIPQKTMLIDSISPRTDFEVESITGPALSGTEITLAVGQAVQFNAIGSVNKGSNQQQTGVKILNNFVVTDPTVMHVDELGVGAAENAGETSVTTTNNVGAQRKVIVNQVYKLKFMCHLASHDNGIEGWMTGGTIGLQRDDDGDGNDDVVCHVAFEQNGETLTDNTDTLGTIDNINEANKAYKLLKNKGYNVYITNAILIDGKEYLGYANVEDNADGKSAKFLIKYNAYTNVAVHEWGHCLGIRHGPADRGPGTNIPNAEHLMWPESHFGWNFRVTKAIANIFEKRKP